MNRNDVLDKIINLLIKNHDELLKDYQPVSCCGENNIIKFVFKSPDAKKISDLLLELNKHE